MTNRKQNINKKFFGGRKLVEGYSFWRQVMNKKTFKYCLISLIAVNFIFTASLSYAGCSPQVTDCLPFSDDHLLPKCGSHSVDWEMIPGSYENCPNPSSEVKYKIYDCASCCPSISSFTSENNSLSPSNGSNDGTDFDYSFSGAYNSKKITVIGGSGSIDLEGDSWDGMMNEKFTAGMYESEFWMQPYLPSCGGAIGKSNPESLAVLPEGGGGKCEPKCTSKDKETGSTVDVAYGSLDHDQPLFNMAAINFTLFYNSRDGYKGDISTGWTHNYDMRVKYFFKAGAFMLRAGKSVNFFTCTPSNSLCTKYPGTEDDQSSFYLDTSDYSFLWVTKEGVEYQFNSINDGGRIASIKTVDGRMTTFDYDTGSWTITTDGGTATVTTANGGISKVTDPNGNDYTFYGPSAGTDLVKVTYPVTDAYWQYTYEAGENSTHLKTKKDLAGLTTTYHYGSAPKYRLTGVDVMSILGETKSMSISSSGPDGNGIRTTTITGLNDGVTEYEIDTSTGQIIKETKDPSGVEEESNFVYADYTSLAILHPHDRGATLIRYDDSGNVLSVTDPLEKERVYTYNSLGRILSITEPIVQTYDSDGTALSLDPVTATTDFEYDNDTGYLTSITGPAASESERPVTLINYSTASSTTDVTITDPNDNSTLVVLDDKQRPITITIPGNRTTTIEYGTFGNVSSIENPLGHRASFVANALGWITEARTPDGKTTSFDYDPRGLVDEVTDPEGKLTKYEYNHKGRVTKVTQFDNTSSIVTGITYGGFGCATCSDSESGVDKFTSLTDANGKTSYFKYDQLGRLKSVDYPDVTTSYTYNAQNNTATATFANTSSLTYEYDNVGQLITKKSGDATVASYAYDGRGNLTSASNSNMSYTFKYYPDNRLQSVTDSNNKTISYTYDAAGNREKMVVEGSETVDYVYTAAGELDKIKYESGTKVFDFDYYDDGRRETLAYPNGITTAYSYDAAGQLTGISNSKMSASYTHYASGNRKTLTREDGTVIRYAYDDLYRLTLAGYSSIDGKQAESYTYDAIGNRQSEDNNLLNNFYSGYEIPMTSDGDFTYYRDETDSFWTPMTLKEGKRDLDYDNEGRLLKVTKTEDGIVTVVEYKYDPFGRRIKRTVTVDGTLQSTIKYLYDSEDIVAVYENGTLTKEFIHGPGIDEPLAVKTGGAWFYYHADGLGSIMKVTNAAGGVVPGYSFGYDSFGNLVKGTLDLDYTYTGREWDKEADLYYYRNRFADPLTGQFVSKDPIGFAGGDVNLYSYVGQNPVNWIDPWGEDWVDDAANFSAGFGDTITFGGTDWIRDKLGSNNAVDSCSGWYSGGQYGGYAWGVAALGVGSTPRGWLLGRGRGLLNSNDYLRFGWSWKGTAKQGKEIIRLAVGNKRKRIHWHFP